jgi:hypothetical protein
VSPGASISATRRDSYGRGSLPARGLTQVSRGALAKKCGDKQRQGRCGDDGPYAEVKEPRTMAQPEPRKVED